MTRHASVRPAGSAVVLLLALGGTMHAQGALEGRVLADSAKQPIAGAHVSLEGTAHETVTDENGHFETGDAPSGKRRVVIRAAGYAVDTLVVEIFDGQNVVVDLIIRRGATPLRTITVNAPATAAAPTRLAQVGFDDRRKQGSGKFIDSTMLARFANARMSDAFSALSNLSVRYGSSKAWLASTRAPAATKCALVNCGGGTASLIDVADLNAGAREACYSDVYLNGVMTYQFGQSPPMPLFDINSLRPADILGVEIYVSAASAPAQYSRVASDCGVLVIWTRG